MREITDSIKKSRRAFYLAFAVFAAVVLVAHAQDLRSQSKTRLMLDSVIIAFRLSTLEADSARADRRMAAAEQESTRSELRLLFEEGRLRSRRNRADLLRVVRGVRNDLLELSGVGDSLRLVLPTARRKH